MTSYPWNNAAVQSRRENYEVEYREFEGPHTVPEDIKDKALRWWLGL